MKQLVVILFITLAACATFQGATQDVKPSSCEQAWNVVTDARAAEQIAIRLNRRVDDARRFRELAEKAHTAICIIDNTPASDTL